MGSKQVSNVHHSLTTQEVVDGLTFPNFCIFISFWCTSHLIRPSPLKRGFCNLSDPEFTSRLDSFDVLVLLTPTGWSPAWKRYGSPIWDASLQLHNYTTLHCSSLSPSHWGSGNKTDRRIRYDHDVHLFSLSSPLSLGLFTLEVEEKLIPRFCIMWQGNAVQTK